jgi:hypothetical protein
LPLSGSTFDFCNDVILDLYNGLEPSFVAWYSRGLEFGTLKRM